MPPRKRKAPPPRRLRPVAFILAPLLALMGGVYWALGQATAKDSLQRLENAVENIAGQTATLVRQQGAGGAKPSTPPASPQAAARKPKEKLPIKPLAAAGDIAVFFAPADQNDSNGLHRQLLNLVKSAKKSVDAAFYEVEYMPFAEALIERHRAGVPVRLVIDAQYQDREAAWACRRAGLPIQFDDRKAFMHDKFCIVDGATVWTGSTNATNNCLFRNDNNALLLRSATLAEDYRVEFDEMFSAKRFGTRSTPRNTPHPLVDVGGVQVACYFSPDDGVAAQIIHAIRKAKHSIDFMAFSFTSEPIAGAMLERMDAGVKVRGVFEKGNAGNEYSKDDLLKEHGAQVYMDENPNNMHHKVIIIDRETTVTGSYNFSNNAEKDNDENTLIIQSPQIAAAYTGQFEQLIGN